MVNNLPTSSSELGNTTKNPLIKWVLVFALFTIILWVTAFLMNQYQKMFIPTVVIGEKTEMSTDKISTEEEFRAQLGAPVSESKDVKIITEEEFRAQLGAPVSESKDVKIITEEEFRAQLEALNTSNNNH